MQRRQGSRFQNQLLYLSTQEDLIDIAVTGGHHMKGRGEGGQGLTSHLVLKQSPLPKQLFGVISSRS